MTISGIYIPLFFILLATCGPTILVLRKIAAARRPGPLAGLQRWLNSPATWSVPSYAVCLYVAGLINLRHLAEDEPVFWPAGLAFVLALLFQALNIRHLPDLQRRLDRMLLPREAYVRIWGGER